MLGLKLKGAPELHGLWQYRAREFLDWEEYVVYSELLCGCCLQKKQKKKCAELLRHVARTQDAGKDACNLKYNEYRCMSCIHHACMPCVQDCCTTSPCRIGRAPIRSRCRHSLRNNACPAACKFTHVDCILNAFLAHPCCKPKLTPRQAQTHTSPNSHRDKPKLTQAQTHTRTSPNSHKPKLTQAQTHTETSPNSL